MKIYANAANRRTYRPSHLVADTAAFGLEGNDTGGITIDFVTQSLGLHGRFRMHVAFSAEELADLVQTAAKYKLQVRLEQLEGELKEAREEIERLRDC